MNKGANMKKIIFVASLMFFMLLFIGCENISSDDTSNVLYQEQEISIIPIQYDFESVIDLSDDIFIGELVGVRFGENLSDNLISNDDPFNSLKITSYVEYEFKINKVLYSGYSGRNPSSIYVYFHDYGLIEDDLGYNPMYDCVFYKGYEYILPVYITDKAYYKHDVYHIYGDMVLSLDEGIAQYSSLTGIHSIKNKYGVDYTENIDRGDLEVYINQLIQTKKHQNTYTGESDILKISEFSDNIFMVKVKELIQTRKNEVVFGETFVVEIIETIKGEEPVTSELLMVDFVGGTVRSGDIVYVGLDRGCSRKGYSGIFFNMTSKILFSETDINLIKQSVLV